MAPPYNIKEGCSPRIASALRDSKWFTRGWTLQELIAPEHVYFVDSQWKGIIGSKKTLNDLISDITGIHDVANVDLAWRSIATKMSWASKRSCSRREDIAYCLMGLFDVSMPMLYGEGEKAFLRLQFEILKKSDDESIFAWAVESGGKQNVHYLSSALSGGMLAMSPAAFVQSSSVRPYNTEYTRAPYMMTNKGIQFSRVLQLEDAIGYSRTAIMPLNCTREMEDGTTVPLAVLLVKKDTQKYQRVREPGDSGLRKCPARLYSASRRPDREETFVYVDLGLY